MTALHGYTLAHIDQLARIATTAARTGGLDAPTCHGLAWSAIAEALLTATTAPERRDLIRAGWQAIHRELAACLHARGYQSSHTTAGPGASPRWWQYWHTPAEPGAVDRLLEHIAAVQIGEEFTAAEGAAVHALAVHEDYQRAADALGIPYKTLASRISSARRRFHGLWYAPDTPPPIRSHDKRRGNQPARTHCRAGHRMAGDNLRIRRRKGGKRERICRACERQRGMARRPVSGQEEAA